MYITEIRAKRLPAGPCTSWIAEALAEEDDGSVRYVTVHYLDGEYYTVSEKSVYDFFENDEDDDPVEPLEEYDDYEDAKKSAYEKVFSTLRTVLDTVD